MEKKYCPNHGDVLCVLKTGTTVGKSSYGKHFYMCNKMCGYSDKVKTEFSPKACTKHGALISLRRWTRDNCIQYKCQKSAEIGWCGMFSTDSAGLQYLVTNKENTPKMKKPIKIDEDPAGLKLALMPHQIKALGWMTWREKQIPPGGILADDMGLGKTLTMLSLIATGLDPPTDPRNREWLKADPAKPNLLRCAGTLVVCPASLLLQWENEVNTKFEPSTMRVLIYHGGSRTKDPRVFRGYDIVITTYNLVGTEGTTVLEDEAEEDRKLHPPAQLPDDKKKKRTSSFKTLFGVHWKRIILDEAHTIRNPKAAVSMGCCLITADSHWAVTGTPIQNKLQDMYSLVKFLQLAPFDDAAVWKSTVEKRGSVGMRRLDTVIAALVLRRTKEEIGESLRLTDKLVETHYIRLCPDEDKVYKVLFQEARKVMYRWLEEQGEVHREARQRLEQSDEGVSLSSFPPEVGTVVDHVLKPYVGGSKGTQVLGLLLRLRQCCCHMNLLTRGLKKEEGDLDSLSLEVAMGALSIAEEEDVDHSYTPATAKSRPGLFSVDKTSTKITEVVNEIKRIKSLPDSPPQKSIVVSQWTSMLNIVEVHLRKEDITFSRIDGSIKPADRQSRMSQFNSPKGEPLLIL